MNVKERYESVRKTYAGIGVDVKGAVKKLEQIPTSIHYWQGGDVMRFEGVESPPEGTQAAGNHLGWARTPQELVDSTDKALSLILGTHRLNLYASYAMFEEGQQVDRDALKPEHFAKWVEFAKAREPGLDFNPTILSYPRTENATFSSEDEEVWKFQVEHCRACVRTPEYFATELGKPVSMSIWIPDGLKNVPADRTSSRARLKDSLGQILVMGYDKNKVLITVESEVFGIGMENCTVGSHEFYMNYTATRGIMCLLDSGHLHPTEIVSDKISSMLLFSDKAVLYASRPVRRDNNHVVLFGDGTREIAKEIVRGGAKRMLLALDFFDASTNRIVAWMTGIRSMRKALFYALLMPDEELAGLQEERRFTELMMKQGELEAYPLRDVWDYYYGSHGIPMKEQWFAEAKGYEKKVLAGG